MSSLIHPQTIFWRIWNFSLCLSDSCQFHNNIVQVAMVTRTPQTTAVILDVHQQTPAPPTGNDCLNMSDITHPTLIPVQPMAATLRGPSRREDRRIRLNCRIQLLIGKPYTLYIFFMVLEIGGCAPRYSLADWSGPIYVMFSRKTNSIKWHMICDNSLCASSELVCHANLCLG